MIDPPKIRQPLDAHESWFAGRAYAEREAAQAIDDLILGLDDD